MLHSRRNHFLPNEITHFMILCQNWFPLLAEAGAPGLVLDDTSCVIADLRGWKWRKHLPSCHRTPTSAGTTNPTSHAQLFPSFYFPPKHRCISPVCKSSACWRLDARLTILAVEKVQNTLNSGVNLIPTVSNCTQGPREGKGAWYVDFRVDSSLQSQALELGMWHVGMPAVRVLDQ